MMPEQPIIVDAFTRKMLAHLARLYGGISYGEMVEMLVIEAVLKEALPFSDEVWEKIREKFRGKFR